MAVSAQSKAMDEVQQALNGFLQEQGFRKRARTYSRKTADGLTQVLNFQMGRFEPPGSTAGMRPISSFYGQFTVNLGIFIPEVSAALRPWAGKTITEPLCELRVRLGALVYPFGDRWWPVDPHATVIEELDDLLRSAAVGFWDQFSGREKVLSYLAAPDKPQFTLRAKLVRALILAQAGDKAAATVLLDSHIADAMAVGNARHAAYVKDLRQTLGF